MLRLIVATVASTYDDESVVCARSPRAGAARSATLCDTLPSLRKSFCAGHRMRQRSSGRGAHRARRLPPAEAVVKLHTLRAVAASRRLRILLGQISESRLLQGLATASRLQRLKRPHNWPLVTYSL